MNRTLCKWLIAAGIIALAAALILVLLPYGLRAMGLHPQYKGKKIQAPGHRALIITTSHDMLGEGGKPTGVYLSEMTIPYNVFRDAGMEVEIASVNGGKIPIEPMSARYPLVTSDDKQALKDAAFQEMIGNSMPISEVDVASYDLVYIAGGWGAAYDLAQSTVLGEKITQARQEGAILGSVCHGALGFLGAKEVDGRPLVQGKAMTAVTDKQVRELGITQTPLHPEAELRNAGAVYEANSTFRDIFATKMVFDDGIVTGQNQNSSAEVAHWMVELVLRGW